MACPGGCVEGGGQPGAAARASRAQGLVAIDRSSRLRRAHENPQIKVLYEEFLGSPGSERSHESLHTHYVERGVPLAG